jgi:hypothetical protein
LRRSTGPKSIEADVSSSSHAVTSRSSTYSRTWVMSVRAVTFQSMWRRSSPYWYFPQVGDVDAGAAEHRAVVALQPPVEAAQARATRACGAPAPV